MGVGIVFSANKECGDNGSRDADSRDQQGIDGAGAFKRTADNNTEGQSGNKCTYIALKEVSAHTGNVANVIANVIGNNSWVTRVVFRNTGLHFTDKVSAYVSCFGINTAADTGKQRDGGSAEGKAEQNVIVSGDQIDNTASQKTQAYNAHSHDGTAGESNGQGSVHAGLHGGVGGADVSACGHLHAEETGQDRAGSTKQEADSRTPVDEETDQ